MFSWLKLGSSSLIYSFQKYFEPYKVSKMPLLFAFFCFFSKKSKQAILFLDFLREKCVDRKNGVHHGEESGKNEQDSSLRFFILETLSQRFLRNIFKDFQFFWTDEKRRKLRNKIEK